jgi:hypothetical protein
MNTKNKIKKLLSMTFVAMAILLMASAANANVTFYQITGIQGVVGDNSGIGTDKTYTHAIDFGPGTITTINGVEFASDFEGTAGGRANAGTRTYGPNPVSYEVEYGGADSELSDLFDDFFWSGPDLGYVELEGLTPGQFYDVRLYDRDYGGDLRTYHAMYDVGSDDLVEYVTEEINQDDGTLAPMNMSGDVAWAMSYVYQADTSGKIKVIIDLVGGGGTYHIYGLTNHEVSRSVAGEPTMTMLSPVDDYTEAITGADLKIFFNEDIAAGSGNITIKNLDAPSEIIIPVTDSRITISGAGLSINPTADLDNGTNYAIQIDEGAIVDADEDNDYAGIDNDTTWNFTTDDTPPTVTKLRPDNNSYVMISDGDLFVTFHEPIAIGTGNITIKNLTDPGQVVIDVTDDTQVSIAGNKLTINPTDDLNMSEDYAVRIDAGAIEDLSGNDYAGISDDTTWAFLVSIAERLLYEPFDYPEDPKVQLADIPINAFGLAEGFWFCLPIDELYGEGEDSEGEPVGFAVFNIFGNSIEFGDLPVAGRRLNIGLNNAATARAELETGLLDGYMDEGDELWFSFIGNPMLASSRNTNRIEVQIGDPLNSIGISMAKLALGAGRVEAAVTEDGDKTIIVGSDVFTASTQWVVGKATFGDSNEVTLDVYAPDTYLEIPDAPAATVTGSMDPCSFTKLIISVAWGDTTFADEIRIGTSFYSIGGFPIDPNRPYVTAGSDMATWTTMPVELDPDVTNNDPEEPQLTHVWAVKGVVDSIGAVVDSVEGINIVITEPGGGADDILTKEAVVTITKDAPTEDATTVIMSLTVTRESSNPNVSTLKIDVYDTPCLAAIGTGTTEFDTGDLDGDCFTQLKDLATLAEKYLIDYDISVPVEKPVEEEE